MQIKPFVKKDDWKAGQKSLALSDVRLSPEKCKKNGLSLLLPERLWQPVLEIFYLLTQN
ncbi:MAG: hypothetical protein ACFFCZ_24225 [Promethearchaeota archaeon]